MKLYLTVVLAGTLFKIERIVDISMIRPTPNHQFLNNAIAHYCVCRVSTNMQVLSKNTHTIREETVHDGRENANTNFSGKAVFGLDRFLTRGEHASKYGVFSMGHVGVVVGAGDNDTPWIDEHAVRIRAGMLNVISWTALINVFFERGK